MTFDRQEYQDLVKKQGKDRLNGQRGSLEVIQQAAVKAELLTGQEHWDTFLTHLAAAEEAISSELDNCKTALFRYDLVHPDDIMRLKIRLHGLEVQIATIQSIMMLPKDLQEQGEKAEDLLSRLDG